MKRIISMAGVIILLAAVIIVMTGETGAASQDQRDLPPELETSGGNISSRAITKLSSSAPQPWTRERMLAAQPYPLESSDIAMKFSQLAYQSPGEPGFIAGSPPAGNEMDISVLQDSGLLAQTASSGYSYPPPYVQYQNFDSYQVYPYSTTGVLFFTQYGLDYRCSAASIGNYAIWTAGHCIHKGDNEATGWSTNVVFVPGYKNGNAPFGVWAASNVDLFTRPEWYESGDLSYDMAGALLQEWNNQTISEVVGSLGFAYNLEYGQHWINMGYPKAPPFDGKTQQICAASFAYADTNFLVPFPVAMGCDMTQGSSGGPWILSFSGQAGATNYLNGNNSYRYSFHPEELFSPYFGNAAKLLFEELTTSLPTQ